MKQHIYVYVMLSLFEKSTELQKISQEHNIHQNIWTTLSWSNNPKFKQKHQNPEVKNVLHFNIIYQATTTTTSTTTTTTNNSNNSSNNNNNTLFISRKKKKEKKKGLV